VTRTERLFARRRWGLGLVAVLLFLTFGVALGWLRIQHDSHRADALAVKADKIAAEADKRGKAVSTLAGDVRVLRAQIQAKGGTPQAPDPAKAVKDLPSRAEVPVPIPGPPGPKGDKGDAGSPAPTITPEPGVSGAPGNAGNPGSAGSPGPAGPQGEPGPAGAQGEKGDTGAQGPPPDGWTYTDGAGVTYDCSPDSDNPKHFHCDPTTSNPAPTDSPSPNKGLLGMAAVASTAAYRRIGGHRAE
jgi:hypothetical protein